MKKLGEYLKCNRGDFML